MPVKQWRSRWHLARAVLPGGEALAALIVALALAVAAVTAVAWLTVRLERTLISEGASWLAGDLLIAAPYPFGEAWQRWRADHPEVQVVESITTTTLVRSAAGQFQLVALRAVGPGYPLRGKVTLLADHEVEDFAATVPALPLAGDSAWVDPRLATLLMLKVGDRVQVGRVQVTVAGVLAQAPEQGADFLSFLPELVVPLATLRTSGLLAPGSRATYRWHLAVPRQHLAEVKEDLAKRLQPGERLLTPDEAQPALQQLLTEARRFLRLMTIAAVLLAAVAVALAGRRLAEQMVARVAVIRALGGTRAIWWRLAGLRLAAVGLVATAGGVAIGWAAQALFADLLADALHWPELAKAPLWVAWPGLLLVVVLLGALVLPWGVWLLALPPAAVLRQRAARLAPVGWLGWTIAALGGLAAVIVALGGAWRLALIATAVMAAVTFLFGIAAVAVLTVAARFVPMGAALPLRLALLFLARSPFAAALQVSALAVGLTTLWLLLFVRSDLLAAWQYQTPADAPNRFLINVMPDQVPALREVIVAAGLPAPHFWPMVRGRITAINDAPLSAEILADPRAERLAHREFNLTYSSELPAGNRVVAGQWHGNRPGSEASVEAGLAKRFRLQLGDRVTFSVAGELITVTITSVRALRWESMNPNFFFITTPEALANAPAIYMAALHLPQSAAALERQLVQHFPNVTVLDVAALRREFETLAAQVTHLLQGLFAFTLLIGVVVLLLGWAMGEGRRSQQVALLRALGLTSRMGFTLVLGEALIVGLLAALLSVVAAVGLGAWLAHALFDLTLPVRWLPLAGAAAAVASAAALWGALRGQVVLTRPPLTVLRS